MAHFCLECLVFTKNKKLLRNFLGYKMGKGRGACQIISQCQIWWENWANAHILLEVFDHFRTCVFLEKNPFKHKVDKFWSFRFFKTETLSTVGIHDRDYNPRLNHNNHSAVVIEDHRSQKSLDTCQKSVSVSLHCFWGTLLTDWLL